MYGLRSGAFSSKTLAIDETRLNIPITAKKRFLIELRLFFRQYNCDLSSGRVKLLLYCGEATENTVAEWKLDEESSGGYLFPNKYLVLRKPSNILGFPIGFAYHQQKDSFQSASNLLEGLATLLKEFGLVPSVIPKQDLDGHNLLVIVGEETVASAKIFGADKCMVQVDTTLLEQVFRRGVHSSLAVPKAFLIGDNPDKRISAKVARTLDPNAFVPSKVQELAKLTGAALSLCKTENGLWNVVSNPIAKVWGGRQLANIDESVILNLCKERDQSILKSCEILSCRSGNIPEYNFKTLFFAALQERCNFKRVFCVNRKLIGKLKVSLSDSAYINEVLNLKLRHDKERNRFEVVQLDSKKVFYICNWESDTCFTSTPSVIDTLCKLHLGQRGITH